MLAIGRALMSRPKLLLLDEPSLGLSPILVRKMFEQLKVLKTPGKVNILSQFGIGVSKAKAPAIGIGIKEALKGKE